MKLDRTRPYGEIFGGTGGARYMQDDMLFAADGEAMGNKQKPTIPEVEVVPAAEVAADQAAAAAPARRAGNKKRPV